MTIPKKQVQSKLDKLIAQASKRANKPLPKDHQLAINVIEEASGEHRLMWVTINTDKKLTVTKSRRNAKLFDKLEVISTLEKVDQMLYSHTVSHDAAVFRGRILVQFPLTDSAVVTYRLHTVPKDREIQNDD